MADRAAAVAADRAAAVAADVVAAVAGDRAAAVAADGGVLRAGVTDGAPGCALAAWVIGPRAWRAATAGAWEGNGDGDDAGGGVGRGGTAVATRGAAACG
ncbi:MAG: hypothetical protein HIU82_10810 [Proteobacteria bacterium]|nr:hypothetical protein [Pseudomonadota bacterium]